MASSIDESDQKKRIREEELTSESHKWELYYWVSIKEDGKNHMIGRGEFVRLMFEVCGVAYTDVGMKNPSAVYEFVRGGGNTGFPVFAPPAIKKGSFVLSQTPAIMKYLGKMYGLYPANNDDEAHADQMVAFATDFVAEGRLVFHAKEFVMSYHKQVEETKRNVEWFEMTRLPQFLVYLEKVLAFTNSGYFIGSSLTYVDVAFFHVLESAQSQFPSSYEASIMHKPLIAAFHSKMRALPRIAEYLVSDRRGFFEGNSMM